MVTSNNCAAIMNISGLKSTLPAGGINLRRKYKIGWVKLFNIGAIGV
jgi:hypothetical protein